MINTIVMIDEITFQEVDVPQDFIESIAKRGIAIPVHVNRAADGYTCTDGRKRLSACKILAAADPKFKRIPVLLMNDYSKSGSSFWGNTQNHH